MSTTNKKKELITQTSMPISSKLLLFISVTSNNLVVKSTPILIA